MNCEEIMELMQRYIDRDLVEAEQETLFAHLQECSDCTASFEQLQLLSAELSNLMKVTPPFSIVDSILPKLAEIDAETAKAKVAYLKPKHALPNRFFNWKIATGFAAAAVIISIFAVSLTPTSNRDASDKMNAIMGVNNAKPEGSKDSVTSAADTPKAESAAKAGSTGQAEPTPQATTAPESPTIADKKQTDPSAGIKDTTGLKEQFSTTVPNKSTAPVSNKSLKKENIPSATTAPVPDPTRDPSQKAAASPRNSDQTDMMLAPRTAPSPGPIPKPNPSSGVRSSKDKRNSIFVVNEGSPEQLQSDDGQFIGSISDQTVVISTPDMNRVYTSVFQWKLTDTIILLRWLDKTRLSYQVNLADGQIKHYIIDTIQKTEQEQ